VPAGSPKERSALGDLPYKLMRGVDRLLSKRLKVRLIREADLYPWQIDRVPPRAFIPATAPAEAAEYLRSDNPRLRELQDAYRRADERVTRPAEWTEGKFTDEDLIYFRGQNPFVNQADSLNYSPMGYGLSYYALKCSSAGDLLQQLDEDGMFGAFTFEIDHRQISRDLLDSAREIDFIRSHVGLDAPETSILDIGAGYGRLVYRLKQVTGPNVTAFATDAYAPSTFLCEFYLRSRGVPNAAVVPLNEVDEFLASHRISLATNIHSFSECTMDAIEWWVSRLARHGVRHLMIIPNMRGPEALAGACNTNAGENMEPLLGRYGYRLSVREPRYADPVVQRYGIDGAWISLFELRA
jgi:hypothetical protein